MKTFLRPFAEDKEPVFLYIETTTFGAGDEGLAIGLRNIAWCNGRNPICKKPLTWDGFKMTRRTGNTIIFGGADSVYLSHGKETTRDALVDLIKILQMIALS